MFATLIITTATRGLFHLNINICHFGALAETADADSCEGDSYSIVRSVCVYLEMLNDPSA